MLRSMSMWTHNVNPVPCAQRSWLHCLATSCLSCCAWQPARQTLPALPVLPVCQDHCETVTISNMSFYEAAPSRNSRHSKKALIFIIHMASSMSMVLTIKIARHARARLISPKFLRITMYYIFPSHCIIFDLIICIYVLDACLASLVVRLSTKSPLQSTWLWTLLPAISFFADRPSPPEMQLTLKSWKTWKGWRWVRWVKGGANSEGFESHGCNTSMANQPTDSLKCPKYPTSKYTNHYQPMGCSQTLWPRIFFTPSGIRQNFLTWSLWNQELGPKTMESL